MGLGLRPFSALHLILLATLWKRFRMIQAYQKSASRALALIALLLISHSFALAQDALKDRVTQLLEKLDSADPAQSKSAEDALIKLGVKVLPLLPDPAEKPESKNRDSRLKKIRTALESGPKTSLEASKVTINGDSIRLSDALKALQQQSGNTVVDLREQNGQETGNPTLQLKLKDAPFFQALDEIARKASLSLNFYTAENAIGLLNSANTETARAGEIGAGTSPPNSKFLLYKDAFRMSLNRIGATRDLSGGPHLANLQMELSWEPRLRPIMLKLRTDQLVGIDDKGRKILPSTSGETMELSIRPENPIVDLNLNLIAPERDASKIARLEVVADLTIPLAKQTLSIAKVSDQGKEVSSGVAKLRIMAFEIEAPVWKVTVEVKSPAVAGSEKLDSYRQVNQTPQVFLVKPDAARVALNGGFSSSQGAGPNLMVYEFLFVDIPGKPDDHGLMIEIPGDLKTIPLKWVFENIPLP